MVQKRNPLVLIYRMNAEQQESLRKVFEELKIDVRFITPEQENAPIGLLAGQMGWKNEKMPAPAAAEMTEPMVVLCDITDRKLDFVLAALRKNNFKGLLKAMMTPYNISWSGKQLQSELKRERTAIGKRK